MTIINKIAYSISARNRQKKYDLFLKEMNLQPDDRIIDVGVNNQEYSDTDNYLEKVYPYGENIVAVAPGSLEKFHRAYPKISAISGDGRSLPFVDNEFDVGYSNATVEHVGNRGSQIAFLKELCRVSKRGFITTPNKNFPIEVHTRIPLLHLIMPKQYFNSLLVLVGKPWAAGNFMNLLGEADLKAVLGESGIENYQIFRQRFLGLTMTFTVKWKKEI